MIAYYIPPNPYSQNLQTQLMRYLAQEAMHLSASGREYVQKICEKAALEVRTPADRTKAKRRWTLVYMKATLLVQQRHDDEIHAKDFELALKHLCPIWPFC